VLLELFCTPVEGEPDYYRVEEAEHDGSPHRRHASAAPGRPRDTRRTPWSADIHARNLPIPGRRRTPQPPHTEPPALLRCHKETGVRWSHGVGQNRTIRQGG